MSEDDDRVGYGKPPKHSRFQKGRSGDPRGRPRGTKNFETVFNAALADRMRVIKGGKPETVSTLEGAVACLIDMALAKRNFRALDRLITLAQANSGKNDQPALDLRLVTDDELDILEKASLIYEKYAPRKQVK